ncbi:hypothetical protein PoB_007602100 [Plakobranchus ocellatus]|uniref:Uncharacterized protein n=1 Tax=Plakobranchus ocellatus TaxID=259542 RepID=A0AAV4E096_9GAST|nr:hypothetical protein PoB_007602100 [Plakobranchus ocellatus]
MTDEFIKDIYSFSPLIWYGKPVSSALEIQPGPCRRLHWSPVVQLVEQGASIEAVFKDSNNSDLASLYRWVTGKEQDHSNFLRKLSTGIARRNVNICSRT